MGIRFRTIMQLALIRTPAVLLGAALGISLAFAQPLAASAEPGVARISDVQGSVAVQRGDSNQPVAAGVNAPILGADYITTGDNSRAQVDLDGASSVRLGSGVQMRFSDLDPGNRHMQLAQGSVDLRAFRGNDLATQIDTPSISVRPHDPGSTRVNVTPDGRTWVTVRSGSADVITPQGTRTLGPGSTLIASGSASSPSISTQGAIAADSFDTWNGQRDQYYQAGASDPYVDPNIIGVDDLQPYGHWVDDPAYGQLWVPNAQAAGWSPYESGRWVWEDGYGWTWVGNEPWGWAPYHYGAWHRGSYGWAWYPPGPSVVAVWQPALVAFIGFGGGSGISIALDLGDPGYDVGWVPLAPFEPYYPWYGNGGPVFGTQFTAFNNPGIYGNYRYGVVGVSGRNWAAGQFGHPQRFAGAQLRNARGFRGAVPIAPTAANLAFAGSRVSSQLRVSPSVARMHFAGNASVARRTSFAQTRTAMTSHLSHARVNTVAARFTTPTTPAAIHAAAARLNASRVTAARPANRTTNAHTANGANAVRAANRTNNVRTAGRPTAAHTAVRPNVARTAVRPNATRGAAANPAWQRFGNQRGVSVGARAAAPRTNAHTTTAHVTTVHVTTAHATTAHVTTAHAANVHATTARTANVHATTAHVAGARAPVVTARSHAAPAVHAAPVARTYSAPARTRTAPVAHAAPAVHAAPVARSYSAPARTYSAPVVHSAPVARSYSAPARTYAAPARTYAAPARTYAAPARTYSAPARTYAAPARTYAAPARTAPVVRSAPVAHQPPPPQRPNNGSREQHPPR